MFKARILLALLACGTMCFVAHNVFYCAEKDVLVVNESVEKKADNKIVFHISPPRSLSTVFMRSMEAYGFEVMNEPALAAYSLASDNEMTGEWTEGLKTFAEVKQKILEKAQISNVFIKEISYAAKALLQDKDLIKNPNVYFIFSIRNPHHATISFCKKLEQEKSYKDWTEEAIAPLIGYQSCYELFDYIKREATNAPAVILTENLYLEPQATMQSVCSFLQIPFKSEMLQWANLGDSFNGEKWAEYKPSTESTQLWHSDAIKSTSFGSPAKYLLDTGGQPTFAEFNDHVRREICKHAYLKNLVFYNKFFAEQNAAHILKK